MATFSTPGRRTCSSGPRTAVCQLEAMRQEIGQRLAEKLKHRDLQATLRCVRAHAQAADASLASGSQQMGWQINGLVVRGA